MSLDPRSCVFAIDPGISGAWAVLGWDGEFLGVGDMPRFNKLVNGIQLANDMRSWAPSIVVLERVHSMPKQGVSTTFAFGTSYGIAIGVACGLGMSLEYVTPEHWKRHFRLSRTSKDASREKAIQLFPAAAEFLKRKKDQGRADALLLARFFLDNRV